MLIPAGAIRLQNFNLGDQHLVSPFNIIVLSSGGYVAYRQKSRNFGADHLTSEGEGGGGSGDE